MSYDPKPIDTSRVQLSEDLQRLIERLAENTHELWAQQRMADGWRHGPERNDTRKEHPSLVPYNQLSESEKEYDRRTAMGTVLALLAMGFTIRSPENIQISASGAAADEELAAILESIEKNASAETLPELLAIWRSNDANRWARAPRAYRRLGEVLLRLGEPLIACDVVEEGLKHDPANVRLRQLQALALARSKAYESAGAVIQKLYDEGHSDEETLGILARVQKDLAFESTDEAERRSYLTLASYFYVKAYELTKGNWPGINAATLKLALGKREEAIALAREVYDLSLKDLDRITKAGGDRYWALATLGEASLILGKTSEAEDRYAQAVELSKGRFGDLNSSRRNARFLLDHLREKPERIETLFALPRVAVFVGHMVDQPGRAAPRFPAQLEPAVRKTLRERLEKLGARIGFASAACGSDILFHESMLELGGEAHVVLPFEREQFLKESVEMVPGSNWSARFDQVLERASETVVASGQKLAAGSASFEYANQMLLGLAQIRAEHLETELVSLAAWDGKPGDLPGGTATTVEQWRDWGHRVEIIDLSEMLRREFPDLGAIADRPRTIRMAPPSADAEFTPEIRGLLFADVVGFSKLTEEEIPPFVQHFLGMVGELADKLSAPPLAKNTWGDGLYFVFSDVRAAGTFALDLCDRVRKTNWKAKGLRDLNLRIGLHSGPVYACTDPVIHQKNYTGVHVSHAARIEPITPPGHAYASQAFAAVAAAQRVSEFRCEYVGQTPLAKKYGTFPMYVVRRRKS